MVISSAGFPHSAAQPANRIKLRCRRPIYLVGCRCLRSSWPCRRAGCQCAGSSCSPRTAGSGRESPLEVWGLLRGAAARSGQEIWEHKGTWWATQPRPKHWRNSLWVVLICKVDLKDVNKESTATVMFLKIFTPSCNQRNLIQKIIHTKRKN